MRCWEIQQSGGNVASMPKAAISHDQPVIILRLGFVFCFWSQFLDSVCFKINADVAQLQECYV